MNASAPVAIAQNLYAAFGRGDLPFILDGLATDVEWAYPGPDTIPFAGRFRGRDAVTGFFAKLSESVELLEFEPRTFVNDGETVVVLGHERGNARRTGRAFEVDWAHVFIIREGKVASFVEYTDTAAVAAAIEG
jgi:uncharacterized protein